MVFSGGRGAWDCVCEQARSICNAVVEGRRWDKRVFYEDVAAAAGLATGFLPIIAVFLISSAPLYTKWLSLGYAIGSLAAFILRFASPSTYIAAYNSVIRVASCGLPANYLAVAFINEARITVMIILVLSLVKVGEPLGSAGQLLGLVLAWIVAVLLYAAYLPTFHCLKFEHKEVIRERCGERGVAEAFVHPFITIWGYPPPPPRLTKCCREARVWLYRNVPEARRAALIYDTTLNGLRAVAVAYALYVALRG